MTGLNTSEFDVKTYHAEVSREHLQDVVNRLKNVATEYECQSIDLEDYLDCISMLAEKITEAVEIVKKYNC